MRTWLALVLILFHFSAFSQHIEKYWASTILPLNIVNPVGLTLNKQNEATFYLRIDQNDSTLDSVTFINNSLKQQTFGLNYKTRHQFFHFDETVNSSTLEATAEQLSGSLANRMQVINNEHYNYFIFNSLRLDKGSFTFLNQTIPFNQNENRPRLFIIQTDKENNILRSRTFALNNHEFRGTVANKNGELLIYCLSRQENTTYRIDSLISPQRAEQFGFNIIKLDTVLLAAKLLNYKQGFSSDLVSPIGFSTWYTEVSDYLIEGLHIAQLSAANAFKPDTFVYGLNKINHNFKLNQLDTLRTNIYIQSTTLHNEKLYFTGHFLTPEVYINWQKWQAPITQGLILASIDSLGKIEVKDFIYLENPDFRGSKIQSFSERLFIRLNINGRMEFEGKEYGEFEQLTEYFLGYDLYGVNRFFTVSPGEYSGITGLDIESFHATEKHLFLISKVGIDFKINDTLVKLPSEDDRFNNAIYAKVRYSFAPQNTPNFSIKEVGCGAFQLSLQNIDAEHYTVLVHSTPTPPWLSNKVQYNYSPNFLKAFKLNTNTRVLYQGADTIINIFNLPSGSNWHISVIGGNGQVQTTNYNNDSVKTIAVSVSFSYLQDSLNLLPSSNTTICANDSIYIEANWKGNITWMDGKSNKKRIIISSDSFYYTSTDSQGCVVSSDTIIITKNPNPEIESINALSDAPFCQGDSVLFITNTTELPSLFDASKHDTALLSQSGWYTFKLTNEFGCTIEDSIYVAFDQYPKFKFSQDSVLSMNGNLKVNYSTNADSLAWVYGTDTTNDFSDITVADSQFLYVNAFSQSGCNIWDSILTQYKEPVSEIFPNAFSPNGDGINDVWYFLHPDSAGTLIIYDRWGGIVYHGQNRWDGKKHSETLPIGAYRYIFRFTENGEEKVRRGMISLIK